MGAAHEPLQPYLIESQMEKLMSDFSRNKKVMHIIERVARFHLEFEGIHPFIDGNGRTGRLILNLELMQNCYPPINVKFTDRRRYYSAFDSYYRDNDVSPMIKLIAGYVDERLDKYLSVIR
jgi:Fic family protein